MCSILNYLPAVLFCSHFPDDVFNFSFFIDDEGHADDTQKAFTIEFLLAPGTIVLQDRALCIGN